MDITGDVAKGFFPYTFLNKDTANYVGPIPDHSVLETDRMNESEKREFVVL